MSEADSTKECRTCGETKPLADFHRNRHISDGRAFYCKQCLKENRRMLPPSERQRKLRDMRETEVAWLAGILEGEGTFHLGANSDGRGLRTVVKVGMTDRDVIETVRRITGAGSFHIRKQQNRQDAYILSINRRADVKALLGRIVPYLHSRRHAKVMDMLYAIEDYEAQRAMNVLDRRYNQST